MTPVLKKIIILFCISLNAFAQDKTIDSLKLALKNAKHDTTRCNILNALIEAEGDPAIWPVYNDQLLKLAENKANSSIPPLKKLYLKYVAGCYNNLGVLADDHGDPMKGLEYYTKSLKIFEEIGSKTGEAAALSHIATLNNRMGNSTQALVCYQKSLKLAESANDLETVSYVLNGMGFIYLDQGDIPKALEYFYKCQKISERTNNKWTLAQSLMNIGTVHNRQQDLKEALKYYQRSLAIREELNDQPGKALSLNNIGGVYKDLNQFDKAEACYIKSLELYEAFDEKEGIALLLSNLGVVYSARNETEKALLYFKKSLKLFEKLGNKKRIAAQCRNISGILFLKGQENEALTYALRSYHLAQELGFPENIKNAAEILRKIYSKQNKYDKAFEAYSIEIKMRDSVYNEQNRKATLKKQFQYIYEKQAAADSVKNAELQKIKTAEISAKGAQIKQEKTQRYALYGGLALIIVFAGFVVNRLNVARKQKNIIEEQKEEVDKAFEKLHEKNKEVMDSINYARRIQTSLLPTEKYISKKLSRR